MTADCTKGLSAGPAGLAVGDHRQHDGGLHRGAEVEPLLPGLETTANMTADCTPA